MTESQTLTIGQIMEYLPHRYPFLLIDRVVEFERGRRIVAIKNVTINEPFFVGHFPELPIMPGVLVIEAMAQAGCILLLTEVADREKSWWSSQALKRPNSASRSRRATSFASKWTCCRSAPGRGAWRAKHTSTASWHAKPR